MGLSDEDSSSLPMFTNYRTYLYGKLPFDQNNGFARNVFHGRALSGITTFDSGFPSGISFAYADGVDRTGGGDAPRVWML